MRHWISGIPEAFVGAPDDGGSVLNGFDGLPPLKCAVTGETVFRGKFILNLHLLMHSLSLKCFQWGEGDGVGGLLGVTKR